MNTKQNFEQARQYTGILGKWRKIEHECVSETARKRNNWPTEFQLARIEQKWRRLIYNAQILD